MLRIPILILLMLFPYHSANAVEAYVSANGIKKTIKSSIAVYSPNCYTSHSCLSIALFEKKISGSDKLKLAKIKDFKGTNSRAISKHLIGTAPALVISFLLDKNAKSCEPKDIYESIYFLFMRDDDFNFGHGIPLDTVYVYDETNWKDQLHLSCNLSRDGIVKLNSIGSKNWTHGRTKKKYDFNWNLGIHSKVIYAD